MNGPTGPITSTRNPRIRALRQLHKNQTREASRRFLVEGANVIREALAAGAQVESVFVTESFDASNPGLVEKARDSGVEVIRASDAVVDSLSRTQAPQGVVAVCKFLDRQEESVLQADTLLVAWGLGDPGNLGTAFRSAEGAGIEAIVMTEGCVDPYNSKTVRATAGALFWLPFCRSVPEASLVDKLRSSGFRIVASTPRDGIPYTDADLSGRVALLVGDEARGLPKEVIAAADVVVSIPMAGGIESVNAGVAASLLAYEIYRQRGAGHREMAKIISAINHDLRSPLTTLKGFASTLRIRWESLDDSLKQEMVGQMESATDRLSRSISEVVELARLDCGEIHINAAAIDAVHEVTMARDEVAHRFPDIGFDIRFDAQEADVYADPDRYRHAVVTLVENAADHAESHVGIRLSRDGDMVVIDIDDDGPGMSETSLEMVVTPPAKTRSGDARPSGTGMSLYVVRELAIIQGGDLVVRTKSGGGTSLRLSMPAAGGVKTGRDVGTKGGS